MPADQTIALQAERRILLIRKQKVMLDSDLAELYGVEARVLNQAVKRNTDRFPEDFMFQLTAEESETLRSQFVTSKTGAFSCGYGQADSSQPVMSSKKHRGKAYLPYAFTEQGVAMLSSVLRSGRSVQVNITIMRAFVRLRQLLATHAELAKKLDEMEMKYDGQFKLVFDALRQLMTPPPSGPKKEIGFHVKETPPKYRTNPRQK